MLACIQACSRRELTVPPESGGTARLKIGTGISTRSSMFDAENESTVSRFILASYRDGFLASTECYSAEGGDFTAAADIELPISVNSGYAYTFYVLANFGDMDVEGLFPPYEQDVADMIVVPGMSGDGCLPMAGRGSLDRQGGTVEVELTRLVAKLCCNITLPVGAVLEEARLCQTPLMSRPFGHAYAADPDSVEDGDFFSFSDVSGYVHGPSGVEGYTVTSEPLYVLENMQGEESGNSDPWRKYPSDAGRASSATYIIMDIAFPDGPVELRFYLGANASGDYNLERNGSYTLNLSIWDSQATRSGWSMLDLRCTDNWPGGDFLVGQVRRTSFISPDVTLSVSEESEGIVGLDTDGQGNWYISGLKAGVALIDVIAENTVQWTTSYAVKAWNGTAGELPLGIHGNAVGVFSNVVAGGRTLQATDTPVTEMPDDASLLCAEVLRTALYGADGGNLPRFTDNSVIPWGAVGKGSANASFPGRPDSLFVADPADWENRYGAERLYEHAFSLSSADISLDITVRISNALCTPDTNTVKIMYDDYVKVKPQSQLALRWRPRNPGGNPVPPASQVNIVTVPLTYPRYANEAMVYSYETFGASMFTVFILPQASPYLSHAMGRIAVYADVTNPRSGAVYRTPLFLQENYLHFVCGAKRIYCGKGKTTGEYTYEAHLVGVAADLSYDLNAAENRNLVAEELSNTPGLVHFTGTPFIYLPLNPQHYPYAFGARQAAQSGGYLGDILYYDYFLGSFDPATDDIRDFYLNSDDRTLVDAEPLYDIDTRKTSLLYGDWLVLHKVQELDESCYGWLDN